MKRTGYVKYTSLILFKSVGDLDFYAISFHGFAKPVWAATCELCQLWEFY